MVPVGALRAEFSAARLSVYGDGTVPETPFMNRGTYNQIIALGPPSTAKTSSPQAIRRPSQPHFADQLPLYATWQYKTHAFR